MTKILAAIVALSFFACGGKARIAAAPPDPALEARLSEASSLYTRGAYVTLRKAFSIYEELYARPAFRERTALAFLRTCLLLSLREREIGIVNFAFSDKAARLLAENPLLTAYAPYLKIITSLAPKSKGAMKDVDLSFIRSQDTEEMDRIRRVLKAGASRDEFLACLYTSIYAYNFDPYSGEKEDISVYVKLFPDSLFLRFKNMTWPEIVPEGLESILREEPEFYEVYYYLGDFALQEGGLLKAEEDFLKAAGGIQESSLPLILLAGIYFAVEETEKSLEFYERTLALSPEYREAMLGKAICLSSLGRPAEAVPILERLIELGYILMGESHYWLARNLHELGRDREALESIDQSKGRLPMNSEVFGLAGTLASGMGEFVRAEKDFRESLQYNARNSEALFGLGTICAIKKRWSESGQYYENASAAFEAGEWALRDKVHEIEQSSLSPERKERLLRKKNAQIQAVLLSMASAFYGAALSWLEAGDGARAKELALKAAEHPSYKAKSEEIIKKSAVGSRSG